MPSDTDRSIEFMRGWEAALLAARHWHEAQAAQSLIQARRSRFPKSFERDAQVHRQAAEAILLISPDDV